MQQPIETRWMYVLDAVAWVLPLLDFLPDWCSWAAGASVPSTHKKLRKTLQHLGIPLTRIKTKDGNLVDALGILRHDLFRVEVALLHDFGEVLFRETYAWGVSATESLPAGAKGALMPAHVSQTLERLRLAQEAKRLRFEQTYKVAQRTNLSAQIDRLVDAFLDAFREEFVKFAQQWLKAPLVLGSLGAESNRLEIARALLRKLRSSFFDAVPLPKPQPLPDLNDPDGIFAHIRESTEDDLLLVLGLQDRNRGRTVVDQLIEIVKKGKAEVSDGPLFTFIQSVCGCLPHSTQNVEGRFNTLDRIDEICAGKMLPETTGDRVCLSTNIVAPVRAAAPEGSERYSASKKQLKQVVSAIEEGAARLSMGAVGRKLQEMPSKVQQPLQHEMEMTVQNRVLHSRSRRDVLDSAPAMVCPPVLMPLPAAPPPPPPPIPPLPPPQSPPQTRRRASEPTPPRVRVRDPLIQSIFERILKKPNK